MRLEDLEPGATNVRRREPGADLDGLVASLQELDLLQPIVVQKSSRGNYEILVGQRRYMAAQKLGWLEIDALVYETPLEQSRAVALSLSENLHRRELHTQDRAEAVEYLLATPGSSIRSVAQALGVSPQTIRNWRDFNAVVPDSLKQLVFDHKVTRDYATKLAHAIPDEKTAFEVAEYVAREQPPAEVRTRIADAAKEFGDRPAQAILEKARDKERELNVTFVLGERHARRIQTASAALEKEPGELAHDATVGWLDVNDF